MATTALLSSWQMVPLGSWVLGGGPPLLAMLGAPAEQHLATVVTIAYTGHSG
jgi:hypothetical protein